jgi:hypothetical protein
VGRSHIRAQTQHIGRRFGVFVAIREVVFPQIDEMGDRTGLGGAGEGSGHRQTGHAVFAQAADDAGNDDFLCHPGTLVANGF